MALFYSVTWQEGNFDLTAAVLAFYSKKARAAYQIQSPQRVEPIDSKKKAALERDGRRVTLMVWDESKPTIFKMA
jgi:hypothetical protein